MLLDVRIHNFYNGTGLVNRYLGTNTYVTFYWQDKQMVGTHVREWHATKALNRCAMMHYNAAGQL